MKRHVLIIAATLLCSTNLWASVLEKTESISTETPSTETAQKDWKFSAAISYDSGDFGTDATTNTVYIPFTLKRYFSAGDLAVTIPYIYQESGRNISALSGRPFQTSKSNSGTRSSEGIGDVLVKGSYYLLTESTTTPFNLSPVAKIKLPTADKDEGLGTGEWDETLGLETSKTLNTEWSLHLDLYYTFIGDPKGIDLNNQFSFDVGGLYQFTEDTAVGLFYEEQTNLVSGRPNPRDLDFTINHKIDQDYEVFGDLMIGLSKGSPAVGVTAGASARF